LRAARLTTATAAVAFFYISAVFGEVQNDPTFATIALERLPIAPSEKNADAFQFLRADKNGRLYLLHGDTLQVDELQAIGKLVPGRKPENSHALESMGPIMDAALSPDGSAWLLASLPDRVARLNSDGLRELPPPYWAISSLAYGIDGPVVAVIPVRVGGENAGAPPTGAAWEHPPLLLRLRDQGWQTLVTGEPFTRRDTRPLRLQEMKAERDTRLAFDAKGTLWVGQQDAYRLKQYSRTGALQESLAVAGGRVQWRNRTADDWKHLEEAAQAGGIKLDRSKLANVQAARVVRGLTTRDSQLYLLVETSAGLALDRWDSKARVLERLLLPAIPIGPGPPSVAAGRYGLYLAGAHLGEPIWHADWQKLDGGKWKAVPEAALEVGRPAS
jgi:hypothetical protein